MQVQTWTELTAIVTETTGDDSATAIRKTKRSMNIALGKLLAAIGRETTHAKKKTNIIENQSRYQMPEDCIRPSILWIEHDTNVSEPPLIEVASQEEWQLMKSGVVRTATYPTHFFVESNDIVELYPTPSANITNGLVMSYEPSQVALSIDDYTTGTITANNGDDTITGSGTTFSQAMVGRYLKVNTDGQWYKIAAYVSDTEITLENFYNGNVTGAGLAFTIGEAPNLPPQFHDALTDYALMRYYQGEKDRANASDFKALWDEAIMTARQQYGVKTSGAVVNGRPRNIYNRDIFTRPPRAVI